MIVIGVTWTNGKTTTATLVHHILHNLWYMTCFVWTTWVKFGNESYTWVRKMTSYDPFALQKILAKAYKHGCTHVVMEVSSHGLHQQRFYGINFSVGVLTNITPEHLDYHKTMKAYAAEKKKLFKKLETDTRDIKAAVFPVENEYARNRAKRLSLKHVLLYGLNNTWSLTMVDIQDQANHTTAQVCYQWLSYSLHTSLVWAFNMKNVLAALWAMIHLWYDVADCVRSLENFAHVEGRQEYVHDHGVHWYIDYAHTPDGLKVMLEYLQKIKNTWRLVCVFGAPGERDKMKRPNMWRVADTYADIVIVTDDDPSSENRWDILRDIAAWIDRQEGEDYFIVPRRQYAINIAARITKPWDIVLLAGIGHQDVLDTNFGYIPWSEKKAIQKAYE